MANENVTLKEIRYVFDDSTPNVSDGLGMMHIYILAKCDGGSSHFIDGWYHKVFPPGSTANDEDVLKSVANYLTEFDRGAP